MADVLFIQEDYFKKLAGVDGNVDFKKLESTIIMVQDVYIQSLLGTPLYEDIKTKAIADPTLAANPNEKGLINNYIAKTLVWYVKAEASLSFKFAYQNKGIQVKNSQNSEAADTSDIKLLKDEWTLIAKSYGKLLYDYLVQNTATFPKFTETTTTGMTPNKTDYINGIYLRGSGNNTNVIFDLDKC